jgi:hypothetical protein
VRSGSHQSIFKTQPFGISKLSAILLVSFSIVVIDITLFFGLTRGDVALSELMISCFPAVAWKVQLYTTTKIISSYLAGEGF